MNNPAVRKLIAFVARRHGISRKLAASLTLKYIRRSMENAFCENWWLQILDAQFLTHVGPYRRIRCGDETHLRHLIPDADRLCHDCGCRRGEYHVFGCDSEECSNCGGQAFCCDCEDATNETH